MTIPAPQDTPLARHWDLDPSLHFLNHGSFGACPRPLLERQWDLQRLLERSPVQFMARELEPLLDRSRARLGTLLHCDSDDLALIPNATTGVNTVLRSLRFAEGDELLVTDHEYNASRNALDFVAERAGAIVVVVKVRFDGFNPDELVHDLIAAVTPRTRMLLIDHITSPTGLINPIAPLQRAMEERGVDLLVDGAHGPGHIPIDLQQLGVAYYVGNCHKWLCTPKGAAVLYVRRDRQDDIRPLVISHGANSPRTDRSRFRLEMDWTGTDDPTALLCIPDALDFLEGLVTAGASEGGHDGAGLGALQAHNHSMVIEGRAALCSALGVAPPCTDDHLGNLASIALPEGPLTPPPATAQDRSPLYDVLQDHRIEVPVMPWPALGCWLLRISAQAYNTQSQYEHLANVLAQSL